MYGIISRTFKLLQRKAVLRPLPGPAPLPAVCAICVRSIPTLYMLDGTEGFLTLIGKDEAMNLAGLL